MKRELHLAAGTLLLTAALTGTVWIPTASGKANEPAAPASRDVYNFARKAHIKQIEPYDATVYVCDDNGITMVRGDILAKTKDTVTNFKVNPAGINFAIVTSNKKSQKKAFLYDIHEENKELASFNTKKFGQPSAVCFSPDARSFYVAADGNIYLMDMKKFIPAKKLADPGFVPTQMVISPNGYYLAATDGKTIDIYNLENSTIRKKLTSDEKVNEMLFSPDNSDFAVLSADGVLTIYNTRTFDLRKMIDDLGDGLAATYNFDGKYVAVATSPNTTSVVNVLRDSDRETFDNPAGGTNDVTFIRDAFNGTLMALNADKSLIMRRMPNLKPFYNKLISEEVDRKMEEWLKMMPGETMDQYRARVNDENRRRQRQLFEDEIATGFAGDLLGGMGMSLGSYDRANGVLALNFDSMPTIYIPVPESDVTSFSKASDLALSEVQYGILPDDTFEVVYAQVTNKPTGKTYTYDNHNRTTMSYMNADDAISIELLQQQQMEELRLQELREKVVSEAKNRNVISDHTNIEVNSKVVPDYDADGNKILNYVVTFTYDVEPDFSAVEDFGPGKYHIAESGAASSMMDIVKQAFEGDLKQYIKPGKKLRVKLLGTADGAPIVRGIPYDGSYGEIENEPVYKNGQLSAISVTTAGGIKENEQLALCRALGVKDFLEKNVQGYNDLNSDYRYDVNVSESKGGEFRRITAEFTLFDAFDL